MRADVCRTGARVERCGMLVRGIGMGKAPKSATALWEMQEEITQKGAMPVEGQ